MIIFTTTKINKYSWNVKLLGFSCGFNFSKFFQPATSLKLTLLHGCFSRFLNCLNDTKSRKISHTRMTATSTKAQKKKKNLNLIQTCIYLFVCYNITKFTIWINFTPPIKLILIKTSEATDPYISNHWFINSSEFR